MPLEILNKPGKLTERRVRDHQDPSAARPRDAGRRPRRAPKPRSRSACTTTSGWTAAATRIGLAGEQLGLLARMGAVCDVYDAITSNRPYKAGWDPAESIAHDGVLDRASSTPSLFQAFVRSLGIYPTGSLVRLSSGKLAVVVEQNPRRAGRRRWSRSSSRPSRNMPLHADAAGPVPAPAARTASSAASRPAKWGFKQLDELWLDPRRAAGARALDAGPRPGRRGSGSRAGRRRGRRAPGAAACAASPACARCARRRSATWRAASALTSALARLPVAP